MNEYRGVFFLVLFDFFFKLVVKAPIRFCLISQLERSPGYLFIIGLTLSLTLFWHSCRNLVWGIIIDISVPVSSVMYLAPILSIIIYFNILSPFAIPKKTGRRRRLSIVCQDSWSMK